MNQKDVVPQYGGICSRCTHPKAELMAGSAALMRIMMAELAELISANSIFMKTYLYPGE